MNDKIKIEIVDDFLNRGHLILQIDAGIIDKNDIDELINDMKMIIELRKKRNII